MSIMVLGRTVRSRRLSKFGSLFQVGLIMMNWRQDTMKDKVKASCNAPFCQTGVFHRPASVASRIDGG
jgi:hypothetical protein